MATFIVSTSISLGVSRFLCKLTKGLGGDVKKVTIIESGLPPGGFALPAIFAPTCDRSLRPGERQMADDGQLRDKHALPCQI